MSAHGSRAERSWLDLTWLGLIGGVFAMICLPADLTGAPAWLRVLGWPAHALWQLVHGARADFGLAWLPVIAATELVLAALTVDALRALAGWRRGRRPRLFAPDELGAWKALLILTFLITLAGSIAFRMEEWGSPGEQNGSQAALERRSRFDAHLERLGGGDPDAPLVLWLGDSLSMSALMPDDTMVGRISETGQRARFHQLSVPSADLLEFEPYFDPLLAQQPELLVIEVNLMFLKHQELESRARRTRASRWAARRRHVARALARIGVEGPGVRDPAGLMAGDPLAGRQDAERLEHMNRVMRNWRARRVATDDPNYLALLGLLERAERAGVRCALAIVPVTESIRLTAPAFFAGRGASARALAEQRSLPLLLDSEVWQSELFHDAVHMHPRGTDRYSSLAASFLARQLAGD